MSKDKVYCEHCKYLGFYSNRFTIPYRYCGNEKNIFEEDSPLQRVRKIQNIEKVNKNNDCILYKKKECGYFSKLIKRVFGLK